MVAVITQHVPITLTEHVQSGRTEVTHITLVCWFQPHASKIKTTKVASKNQHLPKTTFNCSSLTTMKISAK